MTPPFRGSIGAAGLVVLSAMATPASADLVKDAAIFLGIDVRGNRNPLSGGVDLLATQTFIGNPLDFGSGDLTLQGPISLDLSTGGRGLSQFDVRLSTAVDGSAAAVPLSYVFNADAGGQSTQVTGTLLIDAGLSFNPFGFYDMQLVYSSRQDVTRSGRFANDEKSFDFDVGPINVSGNIFADILSLVTEPVFEGANLSNPFTSFSGPSSLAAMLTTPDGAALKRLADGDDPVASKGRLGIAGLSTDELLGGRGLILKASNPGAASTSVPERRVPAPLARQNAGVVPEPTVLMLMLLGIPAVLGKRCRR